ncbi:hypothetical protein [Mycobacterium sp. ITM-2016-00318]|uniref:hypothetical protein n=1 Tax=Mycobacterium sp. ITM-2016-00318 TaxID=2099693 RepID=UPI000CF86A9A|nr:hypothetical protein [Mycobacterium sp. ITM-2016-00318]WNG91172.1 hypothetical protein C6A82_016845 [Mycobacterium sp. ITM-2016-00318]
MSAALVVVGFSLVIVLMTTAVVRRVRRNRIRPHRDAIPEDGFRRQITDLRPKAQVSLDGNGDAAEAPRPVVGADDLAALVQRAVQDAPEREVVGDYRHQRRAKRRRSVWAAGTAGTMGATYCIGHIGWGDSGGSGGDCHGGDCHGGGGGAAAGETDAGKQPSAATVNLTENTTPH